MFCDANNMFWDANQWDKGYHALGLEGTPVQIQHVEEIFFCLDNKKFWFTCEKDKYNDVNKHLFDKMY